MPSVTRFLAVCSVSAAFGLAALTPQPSAAQGSSKEPIKVGFITEMSGNWSFYGVACANGLEIAQQEIDAAGGVLGRPLKFVVIDNQSNPAQSVAAARSLDIQDKVVALSGPTSSDNALAIYGYAERNKVPFVVPVAAFPQLTKPGTRYTFRVEPDAVGWGYAIAKFIEHLKPGAKIAIMYSDFAYQRAMFGGLKYQAPRSKLNIVADVVFPQGAADATIQAAQVVASKPDYIVPLGAGAFDITIANQLVDLGIRPDQIIHPYGGATVIKAWGARGVGMIYGTFFDPNLDNLTANGRNFVDKFKAKVNRPPFYSESFCYATPYIIKAAIEKAGSTDREKIRDAISSIKMTDPTLNIPVEFDKNGARKEYIYFMRVDQVDSKSYEYKSSKVYYLEWDPEVIPVYDIVK